MIFSMLFFDYLFQTKTSMIWSALLCITTNMLLNGTVLMPELRAK